MEDSNFDYYKDLLFRIGLGALISGWWAHTHYTPFYIHGFMYGQQRKYPYEESGIKTDQGYMSEGSMYLYEEMLLDFPTRIVLSIVTSLGILAFIRMQYGEGSKVSLYQLYKKGFHLGLIVTFLRCLFEKQKLLTIIHSFFYYSLLIFIIVPIFTFRTGRYKDPAKTQDENDSKMKAD